MGTDNRPAASSSDGRTLCTRCRRWWPAGTMSCPACGCEFDGETVIDDVHGIDTLPTTGASAAASQTDTTPRGDAFATEPPPKVSALNTSELQSFAEDTDDEIGRVTSELQRSPKVASAVPVGGSSSDPPTKFLRGRDHHIELPGGSVIDDYEIDAKLGAGAMGVVYSARHAKLGRRVAIKVIAPTMGGDPQALARFEREARALASLHHPNIVDVYAFGALPDRRSYFVMEYLVGETLDERIGRGRMPLDEALDIIDQMAGALEAAHAQGTVHRDLKPSNTFLVRLPREQRTVVKLLDFGLVKLAVADGVENTASGAMIGTALYISPEQARSPNVDGRTDIYALGCVAYELVLGRHPFPEARTPTAAIAAHLTEPPPQPKTIWPGIPAALDLLLFSMLAKDPSYRPTLAQVRNVIASVRSPSTAAGRAMRAATTPASRSLPARAWTAGLVAFALLVGILIGATLLGRKSTGGAAPSTPPKPETMASPNNPAVTPRPETPDPVATAPAPVVDAGVAPAVTSPKSTRPKPTIAKAPTDAAVPVAKPEVVQPPPVIVKPAPPVVPPPQKKPGRDDTINPYAKRGSGAR